MGLTVGRRTLFAVVCAVAVASIYAAQPVLAQIGSDLGVPDARLGWIVAAGQLGYLSRGLIALFLFASFGTLWSGLALPLAAAPWRLGTARIGLFGFAGLVGALGAARAGRWADTGRASAVTGGALVLLAASWLATGQASWSLWLVVIGVVLLDFAVQAVHVSNQHLLTTTHPHRTSSVVGGYMIFYSIGSALGAITTTTVFASAGWAGSSILGAAFAVCALIVWATDARWPTGRSGGSWRGRWL
jgi:predicted MFS family arabinose efflux permease